MEENPLTQKEFEELIREAGEKFRATYPCLPSFGVWGSYPLLVHKDTYWEYRESHGVYIIFTPGEEKIDYIGKAAPGWIGGRLGAKTGKPGENSDYPKRKSWINEKTRYMALVFKPEDCPFAATLEAHLIWELGTRQNTVWSKWKPQ